MTTSDPSLRILAAAAALLACACGSRKPKEPPPEIVDEPPPAPTVIAVPFRWSAAPPACLTGFELRASADRCKAPDGSELAARVVAEQPPAQASIELEGHGPPSNAPPWKVSLPVGSPATAAVAAIVSDVRAGVIAIVERGAVEVVVIELASGAERARARVAVEGVLAVQLERRRQDDPIRVHLRTPTGARTALIDPLTGGLMGVGDTPAAAIVTRMAPTATAAGSQATARHGTDSVWAGWEGDNLVVRVTADGAGAPRWQANLARSVGPNKLEQVSVQVIGDVVAGTVHHPSASWTQAWGFGLDDGAARFRRTVTGLGPVPHSGYFNRVASRAEGAYLIVHGVEAAGSYVCTIDVATGRERACVDGLAADAIIDPVPPATP